jgi:hypothetical protein
LDKNALTKAQTAFWFSKGIEIYEDTQDPRVVANMAFTAGATWGVRETSKLTPYLAQFVEMMILLGIFDNVAEVVTTPS